MIPALIALGIGALIVAANWDDVVDWLRSFTAKVKAALAGLGHAAKLFAQKVKDRFLRIMHRLFYKEDGKWFEETTIREIDESEVPAWALEGVSAQEKDVTQKYKQELSLTL